MDQHSDTLLFQELRPLCVELSRISFLPENVFDPSSKELLLALQRLTTKLKEIHASHAIVSAKLGEYIYVPVHGLLRHESLGPAQTEQVLEIIRLLLALCWSTAGSLDQTLAQQLFPLCTFLISQDQDNTHLAKAAPSYKLVACRLLKQLYLSVCNQTSYVDHFFTGRLLPSLVHSITILLNILEHSVKDADVQLLALNALDFLYQEMLKDGEKLSYILPGNVSTLAKVLAVPGININQKVVIACLQLLEYIIVLVYDDSVLSSRIASLDITALPSIETKYEQQVTIPSNINKKHRDSSWLRATSSQVKLALESFIPKLLKRNNKAIQAQLGLTLAKILSKCNISLQNLEMLLVSTLLRLKYSPFPKIQKHVSTIEDIIAQHLGKISDYIQFENKDAMGTLLYALEVIHDIDGNHANLSSEITTLFINGLESKFKVSALKGSSPKIIEQSINIIASEISSQRGNHKVELFSSTISSDMENYLHEFLAGIGRYSSQDHNLISLLDALLINNYSDSDFTNTTLSLWSSVNLLEGAYTREKYSDDVADGCYALLEFCNSYMSSIMSYTKNNQTSEEQETGIMSVLYAIDHIVTIMAKDFQSELIDYLFLVVDALASPSPKIRQFAQLCATNIANELYEGSVKAMLLDNVDYLVEGISIKLNSSMTQGVASVLIVICKLAGYETIERFKDVIETMFKLLDYYHGYSELCFQFFQVFEIIALEIQKRYLANDNNFPLLSDVHIVKTGYEPWGMESIEQVMAVLDKASDKSSMDEAFPVEDHDPQSFQEYFDTKLREIDSDDEDDQVQQEEEEEKRDEEVWISPIPLSSYRILIQIINYGDRLLMHPSKSLQVQILKVFKTIFPMLATQYDSLLPQVAQTWDSVVQCTLINDFAIVGPAFACLEAIIVSAKDFVAKRFIDLWPRLCKESSILKQVRATPHIDQRATKLIQLHRNFPPVTKKALVSLYKMLLQGIEITEVMLSETVLEDMLYCCLQIVPFETIVNSSSLMVGDVIYGLAHSQNE